MAFCVLLVSCEREHILDGDAFLRTAKLLANYSSLLVTHCLSHYYRIYECERSQGVVDL
jgi:hypothetical protein